MNARHDAAVLATAAPRAAVVPVVVEPVVEAEEIVADEPEATELVAEDEVYTTDEDIVTAEDEAVAEIAADAEADAVEVEVEAEPVSVVEAVIVDAVVEDEVVAVEDEPELVAEEAAPEAVEAEEVVEDVPEPVLAESVVTPAVATGEAARRTPLRYTDLATDLVLGRTHLLLLADHGNALAGRSVAEDLAGHALSKGLSVALVDAGSGKASDEPGLTDLSRGEASFGDVVQKSADNSYAEVAWGRGANIEPMSTKPLTLVEALGDIYEVVMVLTGSIAGKSTLDSFAELGGRVVLVMGDENEADDAEEARRQLLAAGLGQVDIVAQPQFAAA